MTHREDRTDDHFVSIIVNTAVQKCDCAFSCDRLIERLAQQWPNYPDFIDNFIPRFVAEENQNMVRDFLRLEEMTGGGCMKAKLQYTAGEAVGGIPMEVAARYDPFSKRLLLTIRTAGGQGIQKAPENAISSNQDIIKNYWETIDLLGSVLEHRSIETDMHARNVKRYTFMLLVSIRRLYPGIKLSDTQIEAMSNLSVLHDIGKVAMPDRILNKPEPLTAEEMKIMQTHTIIGAEIAMKIPNLQGYEKFHEYAYNICRSHHERSDGKGYPDGLAGGQIPLCAQVVGLADCYDALCSKRVYKPKYEHSTAVAMILSGECGVFSDKILSAFQAAVGEDSWQAGEEGKR